MAKFLQCFSFVFVLSLFLSGTMVGKVNGQCDTVLNVICDNDKFDPVCDERCKHDDDLGVSSCVSGPGLPPGKYLCLCSHSCPPPGMDFP